jgi:hypothetical protein
MLIFNMNFTPRLLPNLYLPKHRHPARTVQQVWADELARVKKKSFHQLGECFGKYIPSKGFESACTGSFSRNRVFSKKNTFWAFLSQVLDADRGCKEVVRKFQAFVAKGTGKILSSSTSAYCQARKNIEESLLESILDHLSQQLSHAACHERLKGRRVVVVDGTGLSMPDTKENQDKWPQQKNQKPGCGFPQASLCACFNLENGALLSYELGNKKSHELPMLRKQSNTFKLGDIFLGDKGFCSYYDQATFKAKGVDSVVTLARRKPVTAAESTKILGDNDLLIQWSKPKHSKASSYTRLEWESLPETLQLRQIRVTVNQAGFRVQEFYIVTTLLDEKLYPASEIADLYFERWDVELFFRDIKSTLGMDILRCKTPEMIRKEIMMYLIAYNCIQSLIIEATAKSVNKVRRISFKGSLQAIRQWGSLLGQDNIPDRKRHDLIRILHESIAKSVLLERPGRSEPRAVKRRPKPYRLLTRPRREMIVLRYK